MLSFRYKCVPVTRTTTKYSSCGPMAMFSASILVWKEKNRALFMLSWPLIKSSQSKPTMCQSIFQEDVIPIAYYLHPQTSGVHHENWFKNSRRSPVSLVYHSLTTFTHSLTHLLKSLLDDACLHGCMVGSLTHMILV